MPSLLIVMDNKIKKRKVFKNKEFNMDYRTSQNLQNFT